MVPDARRDERFAGSALVTGEPFLRSYLGVPLVTPDGHGVGALCAIDRVPRAFADAQVAILSDLARLVVNLLEQSAGSPRATGSRAP